MFLRLSQKILAFTKLTPNAQTYELRGGNFNLSSPMSISSGLTSNVAVPLFLPDPNQYTSIGFDKDNKLFIPQYYDDTVVPPK